MFPYSADTDGEAGVWARAVLSNIGSELIPWALSYAPSSSYVSDSSGAFDEL